MPKPTKGPRLGGGPAHERLLLANLAAALFTHKSIKTTETKAKRLRPLAVVGDKAIEIEGHGTIPPLSDFVPGFKVPVSYFGIFVPRGVPPEVTATLDAIWMDKIAKSEVIKKYA